MIELSPCADTSHAVLSTYAFAAKSYTVDGILSTNVTLSTFCLSIFVFPKNALVLSVSVLVFLNVLNRIKSVTLFVFPDWSIATSG